MNILTKKLRRVIPQRLLPCKNLHNHSRDCPLQLALSLQEKLLTMQPANVDHRQRFTVASAPDDDPLKRLSSDFLDLFGAAHSTTFSDVVFCVEGKQVHAHRCILAARSSFFQMVFCNGCHPVNSMTGETALLRPDFSLFPIQVPVEIMSYDVLLIVLQFLYSGQLTLTFQQGRGKCTERCCWHAHCSAHVDLALETLQAAMFFGLEQLSHVVQNHLESILDKIAIDDVMRVLVSARNQGFATLWTTCSEFVAKSGLTTEALKKHLPQEIAAGIEEIRLQRCCTIRQGDLFHNCHNSSPAVSSADGGTESPMSAARIRKMRQALDSLDIELVQLMVMGEGLDLDSAHALHYTVGHCSRDVVKALLEMGAVNVNHPDQMGCTALHVASKMANPDMISILLDHHSLPLLQADTGDTPIGIIQELISASQVSSSMHKSHDHNRLCLCLELLQSAAYVADKEDESSDGAVTERSSDNTSTKSLYIQNRRQCMELPDCSSPFEPPKPCNKAGIAAPLQLVQDWAAIESCSSFEQSILTSNHLKNKHHFQQQDQDHHPNSVLPDSSIMDAAIWVTQAESLKDMMTIDKGKVFDDNRGGHLLSPPVAARYDVSSFTSVNESYRASMTAGNMEDCVYAGFQEPRPQAALAAAFFGDANRSTIF